MSNYFVAPQLSTWSEPNSRCTCPSMPFAILSNMNWRPYQTTTHFWSPPTCKRKVRKVTPEWAGTRRETPLACKWWWRHQALNAGIAPSEVSTESERRAERKTNYRAFDMPSRIVRVFGKSYIQMNKHTEERSGRSLLMNGRCHSFDCVNRGKGIGGRAGIAAVLRLLRAANELVNR